MCINRDLLVKIRIKKGFTQSQLAIEAGIEIAGLNRIESGKMPSCNLCTAIKICNALGVSVDTLIINHRDL